MIQTKLPLSVCLVVRNEGKLIRRCLESVASFADEIIIGHDGECEDDTIEIAKEFTDKVHIFPRLFASEPHRPKLYVEAKNEWILQLDGDEYLSSELQNSIAEYLKTPDVAVYEIKWMDEYDGKRIFTIYKQVLFQKSKAYFIGALSEYIKPKNKGRVVRIEEPLINAPQENIYTSVSIFLKKYSQIAKVQAQQYSDGFSKLSVWNYDGKDWEPSTRMKIRHPILLGVVGLPVKFVTKYFTELLSKRQTSISFRGLWYMILFYWMLYGYVYYLGIKKDRKNIINL